MILTFSKHSTNNLQKEEQEFIHQVAVMPSVSDPEQVSKYGFISSYTVHFLL